MPRKGETKVPPPSESQLREWGERHAAGEPLARMVREAGYTSRAYSAIAEQLRSLSYNIAHQRRRHEDLSQVSAARWYELYWSPASGLPSCEELGRRFGVKGETISRHLRLHGFSVRSRQRQAEIDTERGRKPIPPGPADPHWLPVPPPEVSRARIQRVNATRKPREGRKVRLTVPCHWCAAPLERRPCDLRRRPRPCCNGSCRGQWARWRNNHPDAPRPLITAALVERMKNRRYTWETAERFAPEVGANEREIELALEILTNDS
jgi:hypothetical protein